MREIRKQKKNVHKREKKKNGEGKSEKEGKMEKLFFNS